MWLCVFFGAVSSVITLLIANTVSALGTSEVEQLTSNPYQLTGNVLMFVAAAASASAAWNSFRLTKLFNQRQLASEFAELTHQFLDAYASWDRALRDFVLATDGNEAAYFSEIKHWRRVHIASASRLDLYLETVLNVDSETLEQYRYMIKNVESARKNVKRLFYNSDQKTKDEIQPNCEYIMDMLDDFNTFIRDDLTPYLKE